MIIEGTTGWIGGTCSRTCTGSLLRPQSPASSRTRPALAAAAANPSPAFALPL